MIDSKKYIKDNWHKLPKQWNIESMSILMDQYLKDSISVMDNELYKVIINNGLPINVISAISDLHKNNGRLNYGIGKFPVSISDLHDDKWADVFKKVPHDLYVLFNNWKTESIFDKDFSCSGCGGKTILGYCDLCDE